jgi:hypothetical protein
MGNNKASLVAILVLVVPDARKPKPTYLVTCCVKDQAAEDHAVDAAKLLRSLTIVKSDARLGGTAQAWLLCDYSGLHRASKAIHAAGLFWLLFDQASAASAMAYRPGPSPFTIVYEEHGCSCVSCSRGGRY